ncbi:hypothetical protein N7326_08085 [Corynebacterium sp. ES2794-CONJ1]|uniref:hypothetical protein n=1 Tax=unclassified Corynebacterium TaxID=2624378 RepID=UPI0021683B1C|nr:MULTISPECIES: hypothetical protein [unclassified Corynebacterium]MCS4490603.1 hypothetical protein [Corynebacterium sp. ES2775-CONJ]MCS4492382.1 hypothetical protein [Corynebacterium sp. ES2715-CONJ3]MCS4532426.1 hypothetical protein [Corynebacterium sp. ES2730-CONJ]MCU9519821.1 hypothetical protein [Corynebacterium sp. ES2794-CONJ1]
MPTTLNFAVLKIWGMPTRCRMRVEEAMASALQSEPVAALPGTDYLDVAQCTTWRKSRKRGAVDCRQVLNAEAKEFAELESMMKSLAAEFGFLVSLTPVN